VTHPQGRSPDPTPDDVPDIDPTDLLRAILAISPEDAASAREDAAEAMRPGESARGDEARADDVGHSKRA
jgi:hypothetical protein